MHQSLKSPKIEYAKLALLSLVFLLSSFLSSLAQYSLPKTHILATNGVKSVEIRKTAQRTEHHMREVEEAVDSTTQRMMKYFINPSGHIDSIYHYPNDTGCYQKEIVRYDDKGRVIEFFSSTPQQRASSQQLIEYVDKGGMHMRFWEHGKLKSEMKITADSIVVETLRYDPNNPELTYSTYHFDLDRNFLTEQWYVQGELRKKETFEWLTRDGVPHSFVHFYYEKDEGKKPKSSLKTYEIDDEGNVVNSQMGTIFDHFRRRNFYDRHEKLRVIRHAHESYFKQDSLITELERSELWKFDGTHIVYRYDFIYEMR